MMTLTANLRYRGIVPTMKGAFQLTVHIAHVRIPSRTPDITLATDLRRPGLGECCGSASGLSTGNERGPDLCDLAGIENHLLDLVPAPASQHRLQRQRLYSVGCIQRERADQIHLLIDQRSYHVTDRSLLNLPIKRTVNLARMLAPGDIIPPAGLAYHSGGGSLSPRRNQIRVTIECNLDHIQRFSRTVVDPVNQIADRSSYLTKLCDITALGGPGLRPHTAFSSGFAYPIISQNR